MGGTIWSGSLTTSIFFVVIQKMFTGFYSTSFWAWGLDKNYTGFQIKFGYNGITMYIRVLLNLNKML